MDKIKNHIHKKNRRQALEETLIDVAVALVLALLLAPIFIFLFLGIM